MASFLLAPIPDLICDLNVSRDESLVRGERFAAVTREQQEKLVPLAPDVAVELVARRQEHGAHRRVLEMECRRMFEHGVLYVVLLDPYAAVSTDRGTTWGTPPRDFPTTWIDVLDA